MGVLKPNLNVLPGNQRELWPRLAPTPKDFVLYGGTALALRLGHRDSVDFDFFSCRPFQPFAFAQSIGYLKEQQITQQDANTLTCEVGSAGEPVKVSFFGGLSLRQIDMPDLAEGNGIAVASLRDIFGMKCATVLQRNETKDYLDIHALLGRAKISLSEGIACASAIYGNKYSPVLTLQALSFFDDLAFPLADGIKSDLTTAVKSVSLQNLPQIPASRMIGESSPG